MGCGRNPLIGEFRSALGLNGRISDAKQTTFGNDTFIQQRQSRLMTCVKKIEMHVSPPYRRMIVIAIRGREESFTKNSEI